MKLAFYVLLCVFTLAVQGQDGKKKEPRPFYAPPSYYKAEAFVEMIETDRSTYVGGLMDGFFGSTMFGATDVTMAKLTSCVKDMDIKQVTAIITKHVKDNPESWHLPLSVEAYDALSRACPGGLKIVD